MASNEDLAKALIELIGVVGQIAVKHVPDNPVSADAAEIERLQLLVDKQGETIRQAMIDNRRLHERAESERRMRALTDHQLGNTQEAVGQLTEEKGRLFEALEREKANAAKLKSYTKTGYHYLCTMCHAADPKSTTGAVFIACGHSVCADHVDEVIEGGA